MEVNKNLLSEVLFIVDFKAMEIASLLSMEKNDLKFKIAFVIHEVAELLTGDPVKARVIENVWRRIMRMRLRSLIHGRF